MAMSRSFLKVLGVLLALFLWHLMSNSGLVDPLLLPSPMAVLAVYFNPKSLVTLCQEGLLTFTRATVGFGIGAIVGIIFGIFLGWSENLYALFEFLIDFFRSLPAVALLPPFMLFFGISNLSKVLLVTFSVALIVIVNTATGVKNRNRTRAMVAQILGATKFQIFLKVILPEVLPAVATGLRLSVSTALIVTVVAEMLVSTDPGLGRRILDTQLLFQTADMYATILLIGVLGYLVNKLISSTAEKWIHWEGK